MTATALNRMTKILMTNAYNTLRAHHRVARALTPRQFEVEFWKPPGSVITKPFLLVAERFSNLKACLESRIPCSRPVSGCATVPSYSFTEFSTYRKRARVCGIARWAARMAARGAQGVRGCRWVHGIAF